MSKDFKLGAFKWCGKSRRVMVNAFGLFWRPLITDVESHRAVEVVTVLASMDRKKKAPKQIDCLWSTGRADKDRSLYSDEYHNRDVELTDLLTEIKERYGHCMREYDLKRINEAVKEI